MRIAAAIVCLLSCAPLGAHDFWIEPSSFRPKTGSVVAVVLRVGENFTGDPVPRRASHMAEFVVRDGAGIREVIGREGSDPAGLVRFDGPAWIVYRSQAWPHRSSAEKFRQFLREEGLPPVRAEGPQRERFLRFAKALVGGTPAGFDQPLGLRLELVPLSDPAASTPLKVRVVYEGKPVPDALVTALSGEGRRLTARTSNDGTASLPVTRGVWLVKNVHLAAGGDGTWESLWASLTFER